MNYSDYFISFKDFLRFEESHVVPSKLTLIWEDLLHKIVLEEFKSEANDKGFVLVENPDMEEDVIAKYLKLTVPNASNALSNYFEENLYTQIVCLK